MRCHACTLRDAAREMSNYRSSLRGERLWIGHFPWSRVTKSHQGPSRSSSEEMAVFFRPKSQTANGRPPSEPPGPGWDPLLRIYLLIPRNSISNLCPPSFIPLDKNRQRRRPSCCLFPFRRLTFATGSTYQSINHFSAPSRRKCCSCPARRRELSSVDDSFQAANPETSPLPGTSSLTRISLQDPSIFTTKRRPSRRDRCEGFVHFLHLYFFLIIDLHKTGHPSLSDRSRQFLFARHSSHIHNGSNINIPGRVGHGDVSICYSSNLQPYPEVSHRYALLFT